MSALVDVPPDSADAEEELTVHIEEESEQGDTEEELTIVFDDDEEASQ